MVSYAGRGRNAVLLVRIRWLEGVPADMASSNSLPAWVAEIAATGRRFRRFLLVGVVGLGVNQMVLFVLSGRIELPLYVASPVAIFLSMMVTFVLNEWWTWHDRGSGPLFHRVALYLPINTVGLLINYAVLQALVDLTGMHYLMANLVGAGAAAVWNFTVNHRVTWRR